MSQDAAEPLTTTFLDTGPAQAPLLALRADPVRGTVRLRGCLDRFGAELLTDRLRELGRLGHRDVTVQLPSGADADAQVLLAEVAESLAADGLRLTVEEGTPPAP